LVADRQRRPEVAGDALPGRSLLAVPVKADDLVLAVIASGHHEPAFFTSRHVELFTAVARFAAPRLNLERLLAEMTRQKEFYERVLDALPTQIGVLSPSGVFEYVNPAAIADAAMRRWIVGKTNADYGARRGLPMEVVAQRVARQQQVTDTGRPVEFRETFRTRDGQQRQYHRYIAPVLDADGTVRHLVSGGGDVTDVRALEARVAALEAELAATRAASGGDAPTAP
jgi:PAS domain-containing protein